MLEDVFANLAAGFSAEFGAPFVAAVAVWPGEAEYDDGGSIITPADPVEVTCRAQVCAPTQAMRADAGFLATDMRLVVLRSGFVGTLDTEAQVVIASGVHAGAWELHSVTGDSAGIGWSCRGRKL